MGILLSWKAECDAMKMSPTVAPLDLKPPAVPALMIKSGLKDWIAAYVTRAEDMVPTLSTPEEGSLPGQIKFKLRPLNFPW